MIDRLSILLTMQSRVRGLLQRKHPASILPLSQVAVHDFAMRSWKDMGLDAADTREILTALSSMFPGSQPLRWETAPLPACPDDAAACIHTEWLGGARNIVYESSGSSGLPKQLTHSLETVSQEVNALSTLFKGIRHIVCVTPQHHCYGFTFGILMHRQLGATFQALPALPSIVRNILKPYTLLVGYPDFWAAMIAHPFHTPKYITCLSAGSLWADACMRQVLDAGFSTTEIYGSSENGAIGVRHTPTDFTLLDYWDIQQTSPAKSEGILWRTLPSGKRLSSPAQDHLHMKSERTFRPAGRKDSMIQVSGINVSPAKVAHFLMRHPGVLNCRVRLMKPGEGTRLKAFIVPDSIYPTTAENLRAELRALCRQGLSAPERPRAFTFGAVIPINDFGKETDWDL